MFGGGRCGIWSDDDNDGTSSEEEETDYIRRRWDEDMEDDKNYEVLFIFHQGLVHMALLMFANVEDGKLAAVAIVAVEDGTAIIV